MNRMKNLLFLTFLLVSVTSWTQSQDNWFTSQEEAITFAKSNSLNVMMVFAGSDWCRPCIQLKKDILESEEFTSYTKDHLVILYLDFPSKKRNKLSNELKEQNEKLADRFNRSGSFPKIVVVNTEMEKIQELKFNGQSISDFIIQLK